MNPKKHKKKGAQRHIIGNKGNQRQRKLLRAARGKKTLHFLFFFFPKDFIYLSSEREEGRENKEGEKH